MSVLISSLAIAVSFFILGCWLHSMYAVARDSFLLNRQQKAIRKLEKENAHLRALPHPRKELRLAVHHQGLDGSSLGPGGAR